MSVLLQLGAMLAAVGGVLIALAVGKLNPFIEPEFLAEQLEQATAIVRAKVEHPFRVVKQQFGYAKVRYRGLAKNTARLTMLFALSNLWMARRHVLGAQA